MDFRDTLSLIESLQPDKVNITRFSPRPGTPAAKLYDMPDRIKKDRSRELTGLWQETAAQRNKRYVGEVLEALVTERGRNGAIKAQGKKLPRHSCPWHTGTGICYQSKGDGV